MPVTVITVTHQRPHSLERAIASVKAQDASTDIEHLIVIDDNDVPYANLMQLASNEHRSLSWHTRKRDVAVDGDAPHARASIYPRLSRMINLGVKWAKHDWLAFLDDDNEYEPHHVRSLLAHCEKTKAKAVHSARKLYWPDGRDYLEPYFPGTSSPEEGARIYDLMCDLGVCIRGSNIMHDRVDAIQKDFTNSTEITPNDPVFLVDQNLWLIDRNILLEHPLPENFTEAEIASNTCPDDKMLEVLVRNGIAIESTRIPTVRYYLGGISNGQRHEEGITLNCLPESKSPTC